MDSAEQQFNQLAYAIAGMAMQAAAAYNKAQTELALHEVLLPARFESSEGINQSRETIAALAVLTEQHKEMFATFSRNATAQVLAAAAELTFDRRSEVQGSLIESLNWNIAAQATLYEGRQTWITSASALLDLIETNEGLIDVEGGNLLFHSDDLLDQFNELVARLDAVHAAEVANLQERQVRISRSAAALAGRLTQ